MAVIDQTITDIYALYNGDSAEVLKALADESIDLAIYSPPFSGEGRAGGLYHYSSSPRDLSNCSTYEEFLRHYEFIIEQMARITKSGRINAVHCMDIPRDGANVCSFYDFPGDIIRLHEKHGFEYLPRITIWKEPLGVRNRTMAKSLAHRQLTEDSTRTNVAAADYLIPFRKKGENKVPVKHPVGLTRYAGERTIPHDLQQWKGHAGKQTENRFSHWIWRQYASCVWDDIRGNTANDHKNAVLPYEASKEPEDERHVHPLQRDVPARAIVLWSNPGEIVLTPFGGVGTEAYEAVLNSRKAIYIDLKPSFYRQAVRNLEHAMREQHEDAEFNFEVLSVPKIATKRKKQKATA